jgi:hypothetical protein
LEERSTDDIEFLRKGTDFIETFKKLDRERHEMVCESMYCDGDHTDAIPSHLFSRSAQ